MFRVGHRASRTRVADRRARQPEGDVTRVMNFQRRPFAGLVIALVIPSLRHLPEMRVAHRSLVVAPSARRAAARRRQIIASFAAGLRQLDIARAVAWIIRTARVRIISFLWRRSRPVVCELLSLA